MLLAFKSFSLGPIKGLHRAELAEVPDVLVIVGPNGAGKSTLLHELFRRRAELAEAETQATYINPSRSWRRTTLSAPSMFGLPLGYGQILQQDSPPGFQFMTPQGYYNSGVPRAADS